jgi:hypothetical protein
MAQVVIPLSKGLLDGLAGAMAFHDSLRRQASLPRHLLEWRVPPMPKNLRGEIRSNEHPPPHFHVKYDGEEASFSILDGMRLPGVVGLERYDSIIRDWCEENRRELCLIWNKSRPTDCGVGPVPVPPLA